jgi:hypothetical protein
MTDQENKNSSTETQKTKVEPQPVKKVNFKELIAAINAIKDFDITGEV